MIPSPSDSPAEPAADPGFLRELWYLVLPGTRLRPGRLVGKTVLGEPLVLGRGPDGQPFALRDICPHRGIPLSCGRLEGGEIECPYHGWRFDARGQCTAIPSLVPDQAFDLSRVKVQRYPCREVQGNVWVFFGRDPAAAPGIPELADVDGRHLGIAESMIFHGPLDHAVVGLMDPAHGPFVHRAWWWRSKASIHAKAKQFAPSPFGFTMVRHRASSNSRAYRLLGGVPETEIVFRLPSIRIEHVRAGRHVLCGLTAVTPLGPRETELHHIIYWTMPWLTLLKPVLRPFVRTFLGQDRDIMAKQQVGLAHNPPLLLIDDADRPAKWYYRLKNEYARATAAGRPFENPVKPRLLRWRS